MTAERWGVTGLVVQRQGRTAVSNVDVEVLPGTVRVVVGGDGAGKTTLLRVLAGTLAPDGGSVRRPETERMGAMIGVPAIFADLSVDEHVSFVSACYGVDDPGRVEELLRRAGLLRARDRLGAQLSGGMRHKLAVILALLHRPALVLLDEPTTGVDPVSRAELWRLISHAAAEGAAVLLTTTYLEEAERADVAYVLHDGELLLAGSPQDLLADTRGAFGLSEERVDGYVCWRRGRAWRVWAPDGELPADVPADAPTFDDVVISAQLTTLSSTGAVADWSVRKGVTDPAGGDCPMTLVDARGIHKRFGALTAVDEVSLRVAGGEVVGLLGANGAGKTTLIRLILGLLAPDAGTVRLLGEPPSRRLRSRVGYVPQGLGLWSDLTARDHVALSAAIYGAEAELDTDIARVAGQPVALLPLGLRRRLAFTLATSHQPDVLILDEPTSGVDPLGRARLWDRIRGVADTGAGVLVSTHYMDEAAQCDRSVLLSAGRVVAAGTVDALTAGQSALLIQPRNWQRAWEALEAEGIPALPRGRALRVPDLDMIRVRDILTTAGIDADLSEVPATLEEVFLAASGAADPSWVG